MTNRFNVALGVTLLLGLLLISLIMMSLALQDSEHFSNLYSALLIFNIAGLIALITLITLNLRRLVQQYRAGRHGSRLTVRLLRNFVVMTVFPALIIYVFSLNFLHQGIDTWFDVNVEQALEDALKLSQGALDLRKRELLHTTKQIAEQMLEPEQDSGSLNLSLLSDPGAFEVLNIRPASYNLDTLRERSGAEELAIFSLKGRMIASSSSLADIIPNSPEQSVLLQLGQGHSYVGLDPLQDRLSIRVVVNLPEVGIPGEERILQALYPMTTGQNERAESVQAAYSKYQELNYLRSQLQLSFTLTLTMVLLITLLGAVWAALYTAGRLAKPVRDLAIGMEAIAQGDYETRLPETSHDDIGFLVKSFNQMTQRIAQSRDEARKSREQVEQQRAYLQAILGRLSSGVISVDDSGQVRTANASVSNILGLDAEELDNASLNSLIQHHIRLQPFTDEIKSHLQDKQEWQQQLELFGQHGHQVLMCRGTPLHADDSGHHGHVIVFDDITAILAGQRDAAWSEVARRLAHEIKNPLTPIQLSAERLRHKYMDKMTADEGELLDRLTNTIIQQVDSLKGMVNTFSDYARSPQIQSESVLLNQLLQEVLDLFRSAASDAVIDTDLEDSLPAISGDPARLRQVFNNLVKNALEAAGDSQAHLQISSQYVDTGSTPHALIRISDHGSGIPPEQLAHVFEPYVSNKIKGTGLGLAIVKKIIEEHGGMVWMENNTDSGVSVIIRLPVTKVTRINKT